MSNRGPVAAGATAVLAFGFGITFLVRLFGELRRGDEVAVAQSLTVVGAILALLVGLVSLAQMPSLVRRERLTQLLGTKDVYGSVNLDGLHHALTKLIGSPTLPYFFHLALTAEHVE